MTDETTTAICSASCPGCDRLIGLSVQDCVIYPDRNGWMLGWRCPQCEAPRAVELSPWGVTRYEASGVLRLDLPDCAPTRTGWTADEVLDTLESIASLDSSSI